MIINGDCLTELDKLQKNSVDAIVTDPPYELNFMGKGWDNAGVSFNKETWAKCLQVLKPGGYLLAFGGTRTYHRIACAIEDAGFEIRDCIMWLYGSGFPKSMDIEKAINKKDGVEFKSKPAKGVGFMNGNDDGYHNTLNQLEQIGESSNRAKNWKGWGTALKPSYEPIIVARKPFKGSLVNNVIEYGVGGINIDECRVGFTDPNDIEEYNFNNNGNNSSQKQQGEKLGAYDGGWKVQKGDRPIPQGRFPANTILTYDETDFDEVCGGFPNTKSVQAKGIKRQARNVDKVFDNKNCGLQNKEYDKDKIEGYTDSGSAARYFYCAKASKKDRDEGLSEDARNIHPTVKPTSLMQYLVRLVSPKGATILDPFMGSGSTGKAVMYENKERNAGYKFIGIEKDADYCRIAEARIEAAK